jgi:plastocyanin domain-containing protein
MRARAEVAFLLCVVAVLVVLVSACEKKADTTSAEPPAAASVSVAAGAAARVTIGEHGFTPSSLSMVKGPPGSTAAVTFVRTTDQTCAKEVVFPDLSIKKDLPLNSPVTVDVPTEAARTLTFQCGMAMYKGALVVK